MAQDRLEPILRDRAVALGATVRLGTEMLHLSQDANGVTAQVRQADGARSPVRERLGIGMQGRGAMHTMRSVLFRAPLDLYLAAGVTQFEIREPDLQAFLASYGDGRWVLMFFDDVERDEDDMLRAILRAIGWTDLPVEIITNGRWDMTALVADVFFFGRKSWISSMPTSLLSWSGRSSGDQDVNIHAVRLTGTALAAHVAVLLDVKEGLANAQRIEVSGGMNLSIKSASSPHQ